MPFVVSEKYSGKVVSLQIVDALGKVYQVSKPTITSSNIKVNISNLGLKSGMYFLRISSGQNSEILKLLILK